MARAVGRPEDQLDTMMRDLVIGIDASTTAVKAIAFARDGSPVCEKRATYPLSKPAPGYFEQDPEDWWTALSTATRELAAAVGPHRIAALAIGHQRETFALLDEEGRALRPAILWIDERSRPQVAALSARVGRDRLRQISGKPPDPTPALFAIEWLRQNEPDRLAAAFAVADVHAFLSWRLTGERVSSLSSADPLGLVDLERGVWSDELVSLVGLRPDQLPRIAQPGTVVGELTAEAAAQTGLDAGLPLVAGGGDGQLAGLGAGALDEGSAYLALGTSIVSGMVSDRYCTSDAYRTLSSPTGVGFMAETVIRSGMTLVDWAARLVRGNADPETLAELATLATAVPPGSEGIMVVPYWAGMMNPDWDDAARGIIVGLMLSHRPEHLFRAVMEGIAFEQSLSTAALEESIGRRAERFVVSGGGTRSPLLMAIMAAALERPLVTSAVPEAVALGSGILAAVASGWHPDIATAMAEMIAPSTRTTRPDPSLSAIYRGRIPVYRELFPANRLALHRLKAV
ncbi:xylulokinase [Chthonobacter albigriseus]|uniref:xylulokinase n=1 Tax=Chthonobacter albigriseus TaxID=1683161 RepID=UPI001FCEFC75|nr:FGGY family carbohydrate kinase [Chthonobacter albigriseus]